MGRDDVTSSWLTLAALSLATAASAEPPRLVPHGSAMQMTVKGQPMLLIAGELGNSSASSLTYMAPHWAKLRAEHLNTVLTPVSWELIEPREGQFDWSSVDGLLAAARANHLKLVLLWFGAWKNSMSTYAPAWVKRDTARFPRVHVPNGGAVDILSAFAPATLAADQRAFAALLAHLRQIDDAQNTVLMVQVENEIGMLPTARDYGPLAEAKFREPVPTELTTYLTQHHATLVPELRRLWEENGARTRGTWTDLFGAGDAGAEVFTAWHYARFADQLAAAGKASYPLPMYVNVALNRPGKAPGEYPSGGPLPHLIDVWKAGAPHLDLLAPDIYFANFVDIVGRYKRPDNPLFVPEGNNFDRADVPANAFYAFGKEDAIGFGPFSIESGDDKPGTFADAYALLDQLSPYILAAQGTGRMSGFKPRTLYDETLISDPVSETIGDYRFTVSFAEPFKTNTPAEIATHGGVIIQIGAEDYLIAGNGIAVTFQPVGPGPAQAGIDSAWEGVFDAAGRWVPGRLMNGDQTHQGRHIRLPGGAWTVQRVRLYRYQ
jgi:beta-galactosidase GanA